MAVNAWSVMTTAAATGLLEECERDANTRWPPPEGRVAKRTDRGPERDLGALEAAGQILDLGRV